MGVREDIAIATTPRQAETRINEYRPRKTTVLFGPGFTCSPESV
jgi:hypothetical protein